MMELGDEITGGSTLRTVLGDLLKALKKKKLEDGDMEMLSSKPQGVEALIEESPEEMADAKEAANPLKDAILGAESEADPFAGEETPEEETLEDKVRSFMGQNDRIGLQGKKGLKAGITKVEVSPMGPKEELLKLKGKLRK